MGYIYVFDLSHCWDKIKWRKEGFIWAYISKAQSIMAEKSWLQEFEKASGLIAPTVKKQNGASKIAKADDGMPSSSHWSPKLKKTSLWSLPHFAPVHCSQDTHWLNFSEPDFNGSDVADAMNLVTEAHPEITNWLQAFLTTWLGSIEAPLLAWLTCLIFWDRIPLCSSDCLDGTQRRLVLNWQGIYLPLPPGYQDKRHVLWCLTTLRS